MNLIPVNNTHSKKLFLNVVESLYQNDPHYIRPLDQDIEKTFNPKKNIFFQHGDCVRWILLDENQKAIGRIAAFVNEKKAHKYEVPTGGIGFFECIDDQKAANLLFDAAATWLKDKGMQAVEGPINFGENDTFWGLLIEGFVEASYGMNYHLPYYHQLFKNYGFETAYEQITNILYTFSEFPERFTKIAKWIAAKPNYSFEHFDKTNAEKYINDLMEIYNDGWQDFENFTPIKKETLQASFKQLEAIMDEKLIWFSYVNGEPVSFVVIIPDANQMIKGFNGKLGLWQKLQFVYRRWKGVNLMRAVVMGTKQAFQNHGLESALFIKLKEYVLSSGKSYNELEMSWVGDFNDKMQNLHKATGSVFHKKHVTMRKKF